MIRAQLNFQSSPAGPPRRTPRSETLTCAASASARPPARQQVKGPSPLFPRTPRYALWLLMLRRPVSLSPKFEPVVAGRSAPQRVELRGRKQSAGKNWRCCHRQRGAGPHGGVAAIGSMNGSRLLLVRDYGLLECPQWGVSAVGCVGCECAHLYIRTYEQRRRQAVLFRF